jgi:hypothetical protein
VLEQLGHQPKADPWLGLRGYAAGRPAKTPCPPSHTRRQQPNGRTYCVECQRLRDKRRYGGRSHSDARGPRLRAGFGDVLSLSYETRR